MKELSIEEKANAYDKVVNKLRHFILQGVDPLITRADVQDFFHELAESEDGGIKKDIVAAVETYGDFTQGRKEEIYAWIEKQGAEPNWCHHKVDLSDCSEEYRNAYYDGWNNCNMQHEQCNAEHKLEPKFKVGDWVVWDNKISCHIDNIYQGKESLMYTITDVHNMTRSYSVKGFDNNAHLWTIQDAKDGDVLSNGKMIIIFKHFEEPSYRQRIVAYIGLDNNGDIQITDDTWTLGIDKAKPVTKEQRDNLLKAMTDAGYAFDFEKKELKLLITNGGDITEEPGNKIGPKFKVGDSIRRKTPSSYDKDMQVARIEKDYYICNHIGKFSSEVVPFSKESSYELIGQKPTWSKKDDETVTGIINDIQERLEDYPTEQLADIYFKEINWLKSLKQRHTWKPSEKQIEALEDEVRNNKTVFRKKVLNELLEQLKKL